MNKYILLVISAFLFTTQLSAQEFETYFEQSNGMKTPRYSETVAYCENLAAYSPLLTYGSIGVSPEGREIPLLIADKDGFTTVESIRESGRLVLLIEACIHPGESDGKDAGLLLLKEICLTKNGQKLLEHVSLLFLPILNVDGHERFGPYNRINQNGPEEMGWRVTAQNYNMNRDFLKLDAPEMQLWAQMWQQWNPDFFVDIHSTDGADYQYVLTYMLETMGNMDKQLTTWCLDDFIPKMEQEMDRDNYPIFPYVSFRSWHDPKSGLYRSPQPPMLSQGYTALQNRIGLLVETHMLKPYSIRVQSTYTLLRFLMGELNSNWKQIKAMNQKADAYAASPEFRAEDFTLSYALDKKDSVMTEFRGFEYTIEKSTLTGGDIHFYDNTKPALFELPLFEKSNPEHIVTLPEAYIIPVAWQEVIAKLKLHGVEMLVLKDSVTVAIESYHFENPRWRSTPYEGRQMMVAFEQKSKRELRQFPAGSVVIDMNQPAARVIAYALEPQADGSFLKWGFFNSIFEQKEYAETYVMEPLAEQMLLDDPELKKEFDAYLLDHPELAQDQWGLLNWFYLKSPWGDSRLNCYPVGRILDRNALEFLPI